jgi:hypothetical protein
MKSVTHVAGPKNEPWLRMRSVTYVVGHLSPMLPNETVTHVPACTLLFAFSSTIRCPDAISLDHDRICTHDEMHRACCAI